VNLFDQKPKCENCGDSGWVRHPAGGGHFCQICRPAEESKGERKAKVYQGMQAAADVVAEVARRMQVAESLAPNTQHLTPAHEEQALRAGHIPWADLDPEEASVVILISQADRQHPVRIAEIQKQTGLSDRTVKAIVHTLREVHLLPIGGSRRPPVGMFWIQDAAGFQSYYDQTYAQAMSELRTLHKMARTHYPELAGQLLLPIAGDSGRP